MDDSYKTGTKVQLGTPPSEIARTYAIDNEWGLDFDNDLSWLPDGEVRSEGSDPKTPLPNFIHKEGAWPKLISDIIAFGATPAQKDILLLGALNVLGSTLGPKVQTLYNGRWFSPCMMLFVVAPPASGKGALSWLRHIVLPFHDELLHRWLHEMEDYKAKKMKYDYMGKERANLPKEEVPVLPVRRFFIIPGNNSGTGMQANIIDSDGRGIIFEPEADTMSTSLNADYGHFDDALRKTFDHEGISFYRRTENESKEVNRTYLSVLLSGTPAQVARLIPSSENGLFSRFLFYYMPPVRRWQSQFVHKDDIALWFAETGRQWKRTLDSFRDKACLTFSLTDDQQSFFDYFMGGIFERAQHALGDEAVSSVIRLAPHLLRIMSTVAFIRAVETDGANLLTSEEYHISSDDFSCCMCMANVLFRHAMHILSLLPAVEVTNRGSADKEALFSMMDETFTRKSYIEKAGELCIQENTALQWLKRALKRGQLVKVERGTYRFVQPKA